MGTEAAGRECTWAASSPLFLSIVDGFFPQQLSFLDIRLPLGIPEKRTLSLEPLLLRALSDLPDGLHLIGKESLGPRGQAH